MLQDGQFWVFQETENSAHFFFGNFGLDIYYLTLQINRKSNKKMIVVGKKSSKYGEMSERLPSVKKHTGPTI